MKNPNTIDSRPRLAFDKLFEVELITVALREYKNKSSFSKDINHIIDELDKIQNMFKGDNNETNYKNEKESREGKKTCKACSD